jgi:hypothetical protein
MLARIVCSTAALLVLFTQPLWADSRYVTCYSEDSQYNYCRVDTEDQVSLSRQISSTRCEEGRTWGYDRHGVWVDRGCRAEFRVGSSGYREYNNRNSGSVPSWAVGNFQGVNQRDQTGVRISISPEGDVVASWPGHQGVRGYLHDTNLRLGERDLIVKKRGDGFETILREDHGNRVIYHRIR